ncbi:aspartate/glutamate racemase family protein [Rhodophyticola porphyridii]|uniref:Aspartate/glutamate racemase family protein n=2 Tax=Rhodophyticola porphyridii TaxID=1852017 RepID=A0A3L9Y5U0_9RHOB|nr:aspartate/glutamate racemase family protein [Rhodophyticola porphyridii]
MMRRVGILGGMGPQATVLLMQKVLAAVPARDDADHVPLIVDQNPQVPSRIRRLIEGTGEDPAPVLAEMGQRLEAAGAEALAMPCNTAHHYAEAIRRATSVPFLDMVALSAGHAATLSGRGARVGILASPALRKVALFDPAFALEDLTPVYPEDDDAMLEAIRGIKAEGANVASRAVLAAASAELLAEGAVVQIIACTEFSLIPDAVAPGATVFDSLDRLVVELVAFATSPAHREGTTSELSHSGLGLAAVSDRSGPV